MVTWNKIVAICQLNVVIFYKIRKKWCENEQQWEDCLGRVSRLPGAHLNVCNLACPLHVQSGQTPKKLTSTTWKAYKTDVATGLSNCSFQWKLRLPCVYKTHTSVISPFTCFYENIIHKIWRLLSECGIRTRRVIQCNGFMLLIMALCHY